MTTARMTAKNHPAFHPALSQSVKDREKLLRLQAKLDKRAGRVRG